MCWIAWKQDDPITLTMNLKDIANYYSNCNKYTKGLTEVFQIKRENCKKYTRKAELQVLGY